jgi:hypothetical protein
MIRRLIKTMASRRRHMTGAMALHGERREAVPRMAMIGCKKSNLRHKQAVSQQLRDSALLKQSWLIDSTGARYAPSSAEGREPFVFVAVRRHVL